MTSKNSAAFQMFFLDVTMLKELLGRLREEGYSLLGPVLNNGAVVYDEISTAEELPVGIRDMQAPGFYRVKKRNDYAFFGYVVGPHSWKKFLLPPRSRLVRISKSKELRVLVNGQQKMAFIGVRSCELAALKILDKIFLHGPFVDPVYAANRKNIFVVAVNCTEPGENCFCLSVGTGPEAIDGFDIAVTEIIHDGQHYFVATAVSEKAIKLMENIGAPHASPEQIERAHRLIEHGKTLFKKSIDVNGLKELIYRNIESPQFAEIAERCLACSNCTLVCPTCFCNIIEETTDLHGRIVERWRRWDSCFTADFSYIHGGSIRASRMSRYRQWFTHKLATWVDQFGTLGCVGCGRCITWCPVGIDIAEEAAKMRKMEVTAE
ncbi:MAG: 4Fe-4S dicluster domain-containing protein [Candidatus Caldarchaeum sp.]